MVFLRPISATLKKYFEGKRYNGKSAVGIQPDDKGGKAMKNTVLRALICTLAVLLAMSPAVLAILPASAAEDTVYLGDRQDLFIARDSLDDFGWNTAHKLNFIKVVSKVFIIGFKLF